MLAQGSIEDNVITCSLPFSQVIHQLNKLESSDNRYYLWSWMNLNFCIDEDEQRV